MGLLDRLFRTARLDKELDAELRFHIEEQIRERVAAGADPALARRHVMIEFGALEATKEECRDVRRSRPLADTVQDAIYAVRVLRKSPAFVLIAVFSLGTAIGVDTSFFAFFNATAFQEWPVKDPDRVIRISSQSNSVISLAEWVYLADHARSLSGVVAENDAGSARWNDRALRVLHLSANYFDVLGLPMERGRAFTPAEDRPAAASAVAILNYRTWQSAFGGDPSVIGRTLELDGVPFTIVGVASSRFTGTRSTVERDDVWLPLGAMRLLSPNAPADYRSTATPTWATLTARLAPGVSMEQAKTDLSRVRRQFQAEHGLPGEDASVRGTTLASTWRTGRRLVTFGYLLMPMLLVLLLACANVGNLLLARAHARRREIAVRLSLGATRLRLVRQLLTESLLIALAAGVLGLATAAVLPELVMSWWTPPERTPPSFLLDHRVLLFAFAMSTAACLAFGLAPALHCTRSSVATALKDALGTPGQKLPLGLLRIQVALSVVLLAAAGLLLRALQHGQTKDLGFRTQDVSVLRLDTPRTWDTARRRVLATQLTDEIGRLGAADRVAAASRMPLDRSRVRLTVPGSNTPMLAWFYEVSEQYFEILDLPIVAGTNFAAGAQHDEVVIVNETLARRMWPGQTALGRSLTTEGATRRVIGVVRDAHLAEIGTLEPVMFWPMNPDRTLPHLLIRDEGRALSTALSAFVARAAPDVRAVTRPLAGLIRWKLMTGQVAASVAGGVGLWALALAALGLSGIFGYVVQQRTREIGIRMTLGARTADVLRAVLGPTSKALFVGLVVGIAGALGVARLLRSMLYGLSPLDPLTYVAVTLLLVAAGLAAACVPARRAMNVDPTVALRYE
jgi:predicted permease